MELKVLVPRGNCVAAPDDFLQTHLEVWLIIACVCGLICWCCCCCCVGLFFWRDKHRSKPEEKNEQVVDDVYVREGSEEVAAPDGYVECEGRRWPVNRAALAAASPVFCRIYDGLLVQGDRAEMVVTVDQAEWRICEQMLDFVHVGRAIALHGQVQDGNRITFDQRQAQLLKLLELATRYEIRDLKAACLDSIVHASKTMVWFAGDARHPMQATTDKGQLHLNCIDANGRNCAAELMQLEEDDPFTFEVGGQKYSGVLTSKPTKSKAGIVQFSTSANYPNGLRAGLFSVNAGSSALSLALGRSIQQALNRGRATGIVQQHLQSYTALQKMLSGLPESEVVPATSDPSLQPQLLAASPASPRATPFSPRNNEWHPDLERTISSEESTF